MKVITLIELRIDNFKGLTRNIDFGATTKICGANATGKTTIKDAFHWLLFDKDSQGRSDFLIKPVDQEGNEIHNIDIMVEAFLNIDGEKMILKKVFREKWTKKKGSPKKEFTGNTTDRYIDNVPVNMRDYNDKIKSIVHDDIFKILTDPYEFNNIHWEKRREILLDLCGSSEGLTELHDQKKKTQAQQRKINDRLREIPVRIDELSKSIQDIKKPDEERKKAIEKRLSEKRSELAAIENNTAITDKKILLAETNLEIKKLENNIDNSIHDKITKLNTEITINYNKISMLEVEKNNLFEDILLLEKSMDVLRKDWHKENDTVFVHDDICPTCNQTIPKDQIEKALEKFNINKANVLKMINERGLAAKKEYDQGKGKIEKIIDKISELERVVKVFENEKSEIEKAQKTDNQIDQSLIDRRNQFESDIRKLEMDAEPTKKVLQFEIEEFESKLTKINEQFANYNSITDTKNRITDLEAEQKKLVKDYEKIEKELVDSEQKIVEKCESIESMVNERFNMAKFKLFHIQINEGVKDCCETIYNGIEYNRGLNNAARINVGLDIIDTISAYYGVSVPIFIDNAESVNVLNEIDTQLIGLYVNDDKELTIF